MRVEATVMIDRSPAVVWDFYAVNHVTNHPRWDETIELEATSDGPVGVGTVINRRVTRFGQVTQGTMEVTEFAPEQVIRFRTQDGQMSIDGYMSLEQIGDQEVLLTIGGDIPGIDEEIAEQIRAMMGNSVANIKTLIESET